MRSPLRTVWKSLTGIFGDIARHPGRKRRHVPRHKGVVGRFEARGAGPAVPMSGRVPHEPGGEDEKGDPQKRKEPAPASSARRRRGLRRSAARSVAFRSSASLNSAVRRASVKVAPRLKDDRRNGSAAEGSALDLRDLRKGDGLRHDAVARALSGRAEPRFSARLPPSRPARRGRRRGALPETLAAPSARANRRRLDRLDRRRRIDVAVEENEHAARGLAHPHVVDVAHASLPAAAAASEASMRRARSGSASWPRTSGSAGSMWVSTSTPSPISSAMASSSSEASRCASPSVITPSTSRSRATVLRPSMSWMVTWCTGRPRLAAITSTRSRIVSSSSVSGLAVMVNSASGQRRAIRACKLGLDRRDAFQRQSARHRDDDVAHDLGRRWA